MNLFTRKFTLNNALFSLSVVYLAFALTGCSANRYNLMNAYLDSTNTVNVGNFPFPYAEPTIKKYDLVRVRIMGMNPDVTKMLNGYGGVEIESRFQGTRQPDIEGQPVDKDGFLSFPIVGKIRAEGLTKGELRDNILKLVSPILKEPFVFVDLPKRGVTILGEVKQPATLLAPKERANLFELLAEVGYTTDLADLRKVKIYREEANGSRQMGQLNLEDTAFLSSTFFYPRPDDVIFVPARKEKWFRSFGESYLQYVTIIFIVGTIFISIYNK